MRESQSLNPLYYINNINVKSKFIVLATVVFVPMVLFMWMNINRLSNEIALSSTEQEGVAFIRPVRQLIQNAQAHRGMSNAYLSGKYSLQKKIDQAEQRADAAILAIEKLDQQYGTKFNTQARWQTIKQDWINLKQIWAKAKASPATVQASANFSKHTDFVNSLLDYVLFLSDKSGLTVDPEVLTYYLIDIVYFRTLNVIENMGKIRGLGAGVAARKTITSGEATKLSIMSAQVTSLLKAYAHDMEVLKSVHKEAEIKPSMDRLQASIAALNKMVKQELLETETITVDSALYFGEASKSIKLSYETFDELSGVLGDMLSLREQEQRTLLNQLYLLAFASLAIVSFLLISIARNVVQKASQLQARMYDLAHGQFDQRNKKLKHAKDELGETMHSADTLEDTLKNMLLSMKYVSQQQEAGDIDRDIDVSMFKGGYAEMAAGVNNMVAGHVDMNKKVLECIKQFGDGNLNAQLERFPGKKAIANRSIEQVRRNINALIEDAVLLAEAAKQGKLGTRADASKHNGDFRKVVEGMNATLDAVTVPLNTAASYVESIAEGKIPEKITQAYSGDFDALKQNLNQCIDAINALITDANVLASAAEQGKLSRRADPSRHHGDFRKIVVGFNNTLDAVVGPLNTAADCVAEIAKGDIPAHINATYKGDFNIIKSNLNTCIDAVNRLVKDANMLAEAAADGRVETRADTSLHQGDFRKVVEGVNATLETIVKPIQMVKEATETLNGVASEISTGNNDLSSRTERQASSLEKTASSMDQLAATVKQNADSAKHANKLAEVASGVAKKGNHVVEDVVVTMANINDSAGKIEEIISVIDGIAFQTNILALNAAVEAARAGEQGRGFAVVAGEVRSLAQRSAGAAKEIKELIIDSVQKTNEGAEQVEAAGKTMQEILNSVNQVSEIIGEISAASEEQSSGIDQVNRAVSNMDETTQQNAALVEQAAAAAESLLEQTSALTDTVSVFKLGEGNIAHSHSQASEIAEGAEEQEGNTGLATVVNL